MHMKRITITFFSVAFCCITFAQSNTQMRYQDLIKWSESIVNSIQSNDIKSIERIANIATLPYDDYCKLFKQTSTPTINIKNSLSAKSLISNDSTTYNQKASDFYFGNLIYSLLNSEQNIAQKNDSIFISIQEENQTIQQSNITKLTLYFINKMEARVLEFPAIIHYNNSFYSISKVAYTTYLNTKETRQYFTPHANSDLVYQYSKNGFVRFPKELENESIDITTSYTEENKVSTSSFNTPSSLQNADEVVAFAETMPAFPNGAMGLKRYLKDNLRYPKEASKKGLEGTIYIKFIVDKKGAILSPEVIKDNVGGGCAAEAIRLVSKMPKWWPGKQNGKAVNVYYTLPIKFSIKD